MLSFISSFNINQWLPDEGIPYYKRSETMRLIVPFSIYYCNGMAKHCKENRFYKNLSFRGLPLPPMIRSYPIFSMPMTLFIGDWSYNNFKIWPAFLDVSKPLPAPICIIETISD
uniref:Uncharacterized protein n=1 Tax=Lactuca sativa TaxID=4236 RepID=A0A9R1WR56_LACSA|nr:hypothetical protein LSAT_V11C100000970 [Lactuca sativa]